MLNEMNLRLYAEKIGINQLAILKPVVDYPNFRKCLNERHEYRHLRYRPFPRFLDSLTPPDCKSLIVMIMDYFVSNDYPPGHLKISNRGRYLWQTSNKRVRQLQTFLEENGHTAEFVNVPERATACMAGLGLIGMNTMFYANQLGSYVGIRVIGTDFIPDSYHEAQPEIVHSDICMHCRRCIKACPTKAIDPDGYRINPFRCISFINRHMGETFRNWPDNRADLDNWVDGCEVCQDVCPINKKAKHKPELVIDDLDFYGIRMKNADSISRDELKQRKDEITNPDFRSYVERLLDES
ncbi:MAG: 4Fe-4S binding protein [Clostridiaceae bacterium]|nr:4Fe-4S binding protein [Clostridiaceae bacterium]